MLFCTVSASAYAKESSATTDARPSVRGMDFDVYIRLRKGMSEGELLERAGPPDHQTVDGSVGRKEVVRQGESDPVSVNSTELIVKTFDYFPTAPIRLPRSLPRTVAGSSTCSVKGNSDERHIVSGRIAHGRGYRHAGGSRVHRETACVHRADPLAKANFTQEVIDANGAVQQQASGTVQFQRPGKFRWTYDKPYEQIIVGDGEKALDLRQGPQPGHPAQSGQGDRQQSGRAVGRRG